MGQEQLKKYRFRIILIFVAAVLAGAFFWLFTHAYIEIAVTNSSGGGITYVFGGSGGGTNSLQTNDANVKRLVRKGRHEVLVSQGETSYFATVETGSFLSTSSVSAELAPEHSRTFTGDNPLPCMHYIGQVLASYACGSRLIDAQIHIPATDKNASYVQKPGAAFTGSIEDFIEINKQNYALVKAPLASEEQGAPHTLYPFNSSFKLGPGSPLDGLSPSETYQLESHPEGFTAFSRNTNMAYVFSSPSSPPKIIDGGAPEKSGSDLQFTRSQGSVLLSVYSSQQDGNNDEFHGEAEDGQSEIVITEQNSQPRSYHLDRRLKDVRLCGQQKLCVLSSQRVLVYSARGDSLDLEREIFSAQAIEVSGPTLQVVRQGEILSLDPDSGEGYVSYSFGQYSYCGIDAVSASSYTLCLINPVAGKKVALRNNLTSKNNDSIDKKILSLTQLAEVKSLSIYGRFIHVSPELGELVYDQSRGTFGYSNEVKSRVNSKIRQEISSAGIDTGNYSVINPFD